MSDRTEQEAIHRSCYPTAGFAGSTDEEQEQEGQTSSPPQTGSYVSGSDIMSALRGLTKDSGDEAHERVFKINGKEVRMSFTAEEESTLLQKGLAADEKFREASEMRRQAELDRADREDLDAVIQGNDVDAFRRIGERRGVPPEEIEQSVREVWGNDDEGWGGENAPGRVPGRDVRQGPLSVYDLDPAIQTVIFEAEANRVRNLTKNALDKNTSIRYNMGLYDESGQRAIMNLVEEKIKGRLPQFGGNFGDGSQILPGVLMEIEETLRVLGSPRKGTAPLGIGPAPGGGDPSVYPTKKPDHVSSRDPNFDDSIEEAIAYNLSQLARSDA